MKNLAVFVDFTELTENAVKFAAAIASAGNMSVSLIHVAPNNMKSDEELLMSRFAPHLKSLASSGVDAKIELAYGDFETTASVLVVSKEIDLVVIGTHGITGIKQTLFGSNILSLLQKMTVPALVIQKWSNIPKKGEFDILMPLSLHQDFDRKVKFVAAFSKLFNSQVSILLINKTAADLELVKQRNLCVDYFKKEKVSYKIIEEDATVYAYGYGKHIVKYAEDNKQASISIMTRVSSKQVLLGDAEKERVLLNEQAIPVLCING